MSHTAVELHGLLIGYQGRDGSVKVSGPLDACLNKGEMTCLLGPNGAGKSTLLKTLSGMLSPLYGSVTIDGKSLTDYSVSELAKVIGLVLTEKPAVGNMKVEQLVAMGRSPYTGFWGRLSDDDRKIVDDAVGLVGIGPLCGRPVASLSDGERQKVMIAKALAQQTPVIFLDEPTAFLDFPSKVEIMRLLRSLSRFRQTTVFISTHDLEIALQIADRVWLLDKHHGLKTGTPRGLAADGSLGVYFDREGICYDSLGGHFRILMQDQ